MADPLHLTARRCLNHPGREAAARCPECVRFFCRECVVEHGERVVCSACLGRLAAAGEPRRRRLAALRQAGAPVLGLVTAWFFFYLLVQVLLLTPDTFHVTTAPTRRPAEGAE